MTNSQLNVHRSKLSKILLATAGTISVGLGILGIFLPVMPTTIFLIIAAYCYVRSSDKLYNWLINHKILGPYISNYHRYKAMPKRAKIVAISMLWISIIISSYVVSKLWVSIILIIIAISVTIYILSIKTLTKEQLAELHGQYENS